MEDTSLGRGMEVIRIDVTGIKAGLAHLIPIRETRTETSTGSRILILVEDATSRATTGVLPTRGEDLRHDRDPGPDRPRLLEDAEDPTQARRLRPDGRETGTIRPLRQLVVASQLDEGNARDRDRRRDRLLLLGEGVMLLGKGGVRRMAGRRGRRKTTGRPVERGEFPYSPMSDILA